MNGIKLCEEFYNDIVRDIVTPIYPNHGAGIIGTGSEILGYDTDLSEDHGYYARCIIFTDGCDDVTKQQIKDAVENNLPAEYKGYNTNVVVCSAWEFFRGTTGFDPYNITVYEWLDVPTQSFLELVSGKIFKTSEALGNFRKKFSFYPHDLQLYLIASQWERIGQEMAFMGRCGDVGDDLGSSLVASRLVTYIMRMCFLYEKKYAPYWKWFGTAFSKLNCAGRLSPVLTSVMRADNWKEREQYLTEAYIILGEIHNESKLTKHIKPEAVQYYTRPYIVAKTGEYKSALTDEITDNEIKQLPPDIGGIDHISDQTDFLGHIEMRASVIKIWKKDDFQKAVLG